MELNNGGYSTRDPKSGFENTANEKTSNYSQELVQSSFSDDQFDSTCSTPYVSAPSSPGRGAGPVNGGFYYSAPASPMHFALTASYPVLSSSSPDTAGSSGGGGGSVGVGFEFGSGSGAMSSADELFLDGKIRPMKLSTHLERPQVLAPLPDLEQEEDDEEISVSSTRGRDPRVVRDKSMRRRTRSLSPLRSASLKWDGDDESDDVKQQQHKIAPYLDKDNIKDKEGKNENSKNEETTIAAAAAAAAASLSASSSRSSSAGRSSKRWVFLKDFLYRSKSEGRSNNKFWSTISFSPVLHKEKKLPTSSTPSSTTSENNDNNNNNVQKGKGNSAAQVKKPVNGIGKRRVPPSPHELHYTANRAQAEEMRKKTFLPYRQGLLGCLGFSSKGYGAMNGLARALNPVSSR